MGCKKLTTFFMWGECGALCHTYQPDNIEEKCLHKYIVVKRRFSSRVLSIYMKSLPFITLLVYNSIILQFYYFQKSISQ